MKTIYVVHKFYYNLPFSKLTNFLQIYKRVQVLKTVAQKVNLYYFLTFLMKSLDVFSFNAVIRY